jgi:hypothetical protein
MATAPALEELKYPVGGFTPPESYSDSDRAQRIQVITDLPKNFLAAAKGLSDAQLDTPYRPEGWTVRQLIHHVADSHMNAFIRFKLALTENVPTVKPYNEKLWADLADAKLPVEPSLRIIEDVHTRWVAVLKSMKASDFAKQLVHPERGQISLDWMLALYTWHSKHHTAHIAKLRERNGW